MSVKTVFEKIESFVSKEVKGAEAFIEKAATIEKAVAAEFTNTLIPDIQPGIGAAVEDTVRYGHGWRALPQRLHYSQYCLIQGFPLQLLTAVSDGYRFAHGITSGEYADRPLLPEYSGS